MSHYLVQARYSTDGCAALLKNPQDRTEAVRAMIEKLGGTYVQSYFTEDLGQLVGLVELPDDRAMACLSAAVRASHAIAEIGVTKLITSSDAVELFQQAAGVDYQAPA